MTEAAQVDELDASIKEEVEAGTKEPGSTELLKDEIVQPKADPAPAKVDETTEQDSVQKRINKITAGKYEEKRRADALQTEIDALRANQPAPIEPKEPNLEDFDFDDAKYQDALVDYKIEQKMKDQVALQTQQENRYRALQTQQAFNTKVSDFTENATDYQDVISNVPVLPPETLDAIMQMENGPQVAYYLGKHLDVADEIAIANPMMAAMKLGEIRMSLAKPKPSTKQSAAPEPVDTLTPGGTTNKDIGEMSMEEIYNS